MRSRARPLPGSLLSPALLVLLAGILSAPAFGAPMREVLSWVLGWTFSPEWQRVALSAAAVWMQNGVWIALTIVVLGRGSLGRALSALTLRWRGWPRISAELWAGAKWGLMLLVANVLLVRLSLSVWSWLVPPEVLEERVAREQGALLALFQADHPSWLLALLFVTTAVLAPVGEEVLFRGFLHRALRGRIGRWAMVVSSALFAAIHFYIVHFVAIFAMGMLLAWLYERRGSLWAPIAAHAVVNSVVASAYLAYSGGVPA